MQDRWQFSSLGEEKAGLNCISHRNQDGFSYWGPGLLEDVASPGGVGRGFGSPRPFTGMWMPGKCTHSAESERRGCCTAHDIGNQLTSVDRYGPGGLWSL